jgi:hypothetical protein
VCDFSVVVGVWLWVCVCVWLFDVSVDVGVICLCVCAGVCDCESQTPPICGSLSIETFSAELLETKVTDGISPNNTFVGN